ncbi:MAG TPA: hypothetical protein PK317_00565 [Coprothermobacter proteolyticus]|nr:hypothetical protein [Coprothermobacter proteolyticus]
MAETFKSARLKNVGVTAQQLYTPPVSKKSILIELDVANVSAEAVQCSVFYSTSGTSEGNRFYIVKQAVVPANDTLQVVAGQKIVIEAGHLIGVESSAATSIDVVSSILEDVA